VLRVTQGGRHLRDTDPGEGLGEIALLRNVPRTATVAALEPCVLLALERADFLEAVTGHELAHDVAERIAGERTGEVRGETVVRDAAEPGGGDAGAA
jgi:CRP-like cAMP-binding protein